MRYNYRIRHLHRKGKPSKGVNVNSVSELSADRNKQVEKKFKKAVNAAVKELKSANEETRPSIVQKLRDVMKEYMVYDWYYKEITPDRTNKELLEFVKHNKSVFYPHEDVYFRKANFVYHFFQPYLVDEECIVTTDMVNELLEKVDKVIESAKTDGVITPEGNVNERFFCCKGYLDLSEKENKEMPRNWTMVAQDELPTCDGFFFGSTEYDVWYLSNILSCKEQFTKLLADWKDNEVVYCIMSW